MIVVRSEEKNLLLSMGKEKEREKRSEGGGGDIEEGEISDDSIEEISEHVFKKQEVVKKEGGGGESGSSSNSRVWMTRDLYNYSVSSNYGSGFHNLAWAQAVQNKPLNEVLDFGSNEKSSSSNNNNKRLISSVIIDDTSEEEEVDSKAEDGDVVVGPVEKEEGELEEGEIGLDSEMVESIKQDDNNDDLEIGLIDERIKSTREALETVTVNAVEKSFVEVCLRLQVALDSVQLMRSENGASKVDSLIQLGFNGFRILNIVFSSMDSKQQEESKDFWLRLISHIKNQNPIMFSFEQMKEVETVKASLELKSVSLNVMEMEVDQELRVNTGAKVNSNNLGILGEKPEPVLKSLKMSLLQPISVKHGNQNNANARVESLKQGILPLPRVRVGFGPLLDLHRDHDVDSLPSPTRETPTPFHIQKQKIVGDGVLKSEPSPMVANKVEDARAQSYETDALKAVCSYQEKFGRTKFSLSSRLPSPTPSEECDNGDGDPGEEVSSSSITGKAESVHPPVPSQPVGSATQHMGSSIGQGLLPATSVGQVASGLNPVVKASAKSRDPRLRFANAEASVLNQRPLLTDIPKGEVEGSRKQKNLADLDGHAVKRQRNGLTTHSVSSDVPMVSAAGTVVNDRIQSTENLATNIRKSDAVETFTGERHETSRGNLNVRMDGNEQLPVIGTNPTVSLPDLLKDIVGNPTLLMHILMEQQKLAAEAQGRVSNSSQSTPSFSSSGVAGSVSFVNTAPLNTKVIQPETGRKPHFPSQAISTNPQGESGKVRMKARDPRRILLNSVLQNKESLGSEQFKINGATSPATQASNENGKVRLQGGHAQTNALPSQSAAPPDIAWQFTNKLKNLADIMSSSQASSTVPTVSQTGSTLPIKANMRVALTNSKAQQSVGFTPEGVAGPPRSQNSWGDVAHLFEGYDDQQKAAIQRERARRIEEQNKMFAARKLCLVLDLDHTLLNSAKFNEIESVHEDILRKKEEQDREKPQRHLFRFSHMGMWTKLRPGVWNFLEKASKLFELHLYTMGNKLYATEMAKVLDPTGALFAGRVISRGDEGGPFDSDDKMQPKSKDLEGVLGMESSVVIIDDSVKVWPHNQLNLILVERYTYFPCSRRQFGLPGPSLLEIDHDERTEDGTLASSLGVIERIHHNFFSYPSLHDMDVRNILAMEQQRILAGCCILFSRIFPVGEANPQQHPLWQTAQQFGATCTTQIDDRVTHVVATSLGTDKVNWALSTGRYVVHPGWVEASALLYRRVNEFDFIVKQNLP